MGNNTEKESEISLVRREVEYKRRIAEEKGLDRLFLDVYHDSVRHYPLWLLSAGFKKFVYPRVREAGENTIKDPLGDIRITEFSIGSRKYKITSQQHGSFFTRNVYYYMELFLNGEKVFAVSEKHDARSEKKNYYTLNINAYTNEDWVEDFLGIKKYQEQMEREAGAEGLAEENEQAIVQLKKDFNIGQGRIPRRMFWSRLPWPRLLLLLIVLALTILLFVELSLLYSGR